jgi:hypothetical protein
MSTSPLVIGEWSSDSANAAEPETSPTPAVIAPAATTPFLKNERRLLRPVTTVPSFFISFSFFSKHFKHFEITIQMETRDHTPVRRDQKAHFHWDEELPLALRRIRNTPQELHAEGEDASKLQRIASLQCRFWWIG